MNVKRFTGRTSRDALMLVRQAFGDDAVVVSTRPCPEGVEVLAMAPESVQQLERVAAQSSAQPAAPARRAPARPAATSASPRVAQAVQEQEVEQDVEQEAVQLCFRQRERAFLLQRVLGRDDHERLRQRARHGATGHLLLRHGFQQGGLDLRRRAIDLVDQDE